MARDKLIDVLTHVLGIIAGFIPSLVVLLVTKDATTKKHAKNALNWQISLFIYAVVASILVLILIGLLILPILGILNIVFSILAAVKASNSEVWNYPLTIPFIK